MAPAVEDPAEMPSARAANSAAFAGELPRTRARTMTSTDEIDSTITRPGSVRINVKGAFIVDPDTSTPAVRQGQNGRVSPSHHETSDIRLPNHTAVVSHIAVDVSHEETFCGFLHCPLWSCIWFFFKRGRLPLIVFALPPPPQLSSISDHEPRRNRSEVPWRS
jgi:hypothetical protein